MKTAVDNGEKLSIPHEIILLLLYALGQKVLKKLILESLDILRNEGPHDPCLCRFYLSMVRLEIQTKPGVAAHVSNSSAKEVKGSRSLSSRLPWHTY